MQNNKKIILVVLFFAVVACDNNDKELQDSSPVMEPKILKTEKSIPKTGNTITENEPVTTYEECLQEYLLKGEVSFTGEIMCFEYK